MTKEILLPFLDFDRINLIRQLGNGHIHQTSLVLLQQGAEEKAYVLQNLNERVFKNPVAVMQNLELIAQYLHQQVDYRMEILTPLPTKSGHTYHQTVDSKYWRMFPFFSNTLSYSRAWQAEQAFQAAKAFGHFSRTLQGFPVDQLALTISGFHDSLSRYENFQTVLTTAPANRLLSADETISFVQESAVIFGHIAQLDLPLRAVHNDTKIDNVLMNEETGEGFCVIDLDTVMPGTILSDFGDMVRTFTNSEQEDSVYVEKVEARFDIFEALSQGYLSEVGEILSVNEQDHLLEGAKWMILEQCLRFLVDYLEEDRYYPVTYPEHNLVRAKNQMALFESVVRQEKKMMAYLRRLAKKS